MKGLPVVLAALFALQHVASGHAQDAKSAPPNILAMKNAKEAGQAYKEFFSKHRDAEQLRRLMSDKDTSIALRGAWELTRNCAGRKVAPRPQRFLGFLEGRTGFTPSLWWEVTLTGRAFDVLAATAERDKRWSAALDEYLPTCPFLVKHDGSFTFMPEKLHTTGLDLEARAGTSLKRDKGDLVVRVGKDTVRFAEDLFQKVTDGHAVDAVAAHIGPKRSFLAFYCDPGDGFRLLCVDSHSGTMAWQADVWGLALFRGLTSGPPGNDLRLLVNDRAVAVFGEHVDCYAEGFDLATGKPVFRFATTGWISP